jgi:saccharopine dehydrogenase (NAD+, L-lysine-forming)
MVQDTWKRPGVFNVEEFYPDPFMKELMVQGLPWVEQIDPKLPHDYD